MNEPLFYEEQRFSQIWIWGLLIGLLIFILWGIFQQEVIGKPLGSNPSPSYVLALLTLLPLGLIWFFYNLKLTTTITTEKIHIHYNFLANRTIPIQEIKKAYVRKYSPIREFGGWGLRYGGKGMAYNVSGNQGLQLELTKGKLVLIGTQKSSELKKVVKQLGW